MKPTRQQIVRALRDTRGGLDDADETALLRIWRTMDPADRKAALDRTETTKAKAARPATRGRTKDEEHHAPAIESE